MSQTRLSLAGVVASALVGVVGCGASDARPHRLTIDFGSYASGTDGAAEQRIRAYLAAHAELKLVSERRWGMEGEHALSIEAPSRDVSNQAFKDIRALIPRESRRAWTEVRLDDGQVFRTAWPANRR